MADTAYGSCCVDEVAASHVDAECVVHYGHACMSPTSTLPALFVFGKAEMDVKDCVECLYRCMSSGKKPVLVLFGLEYAHALQDIKSAVADTMSLDGSSTSVHYAEVICSIMNPSQDKTGKDHLQPHDHAGVNSNDKLPSKTESRHGLGGLTWNMPVGQRMEDSLLFWIGSEDPAFANLVLTFNNSEVVRYDAKESKLLNDFSHQQRILKRRYYLVEKAKDANIVGILVGTLGVAGYLHMVRQMKELIEGAGKKSYTLVMGRPNSHKLANFPECDVFIFVSCAQTALLDSKEFLAPVITPFEAILAFSRRKQWTGEYVMEFRDLVNSCTAEVGKGMVEDEARFSFLQGGYMEDFQPEENGGEQKESSMDLIEATEKALTMKTESVDSILFKGTARSGAEFFAARSYQGLNVDYKNPSPQSYIIGRTGRAAGYQHEKNKQDTD
ncbi:diphthamide biosynthesis protein 2 isoform X2 [Asparagus officinalis]|nr:diphthamide biosynthesis protein 2 isoform X2 [Asparagus officinalis]